MTDSPPPSPPPAGVDAAADGPRVIATHDGIVAVHKPAWMLVHPAGVPDRPDLCTWLDTQDDLPSGCRPVHRLDAQASGVVLCAADATVRAEVAGWLARGEIDKSYVALVHGRTHRKGIIRRPLADARRGRPLPAVTRYRRLEWLGAFTLLEVRPATGRKHQIRRHLHGLGHPLVGDDRYRPRRFRPVPAFPGRLWLHAIGIMLPDETIFSDPLPPELEAHLEALGE